MKLGYMNNPRVSLSDEAGFARKAAFDYLELALDPPLADPRKLSIKKVARLLSAFKSPCVGHFPCFPTAFGKNVMKVYLRCLDFFNAVGIERIVIHRLPKRKLKALLKEAAKRKLTLLLEDIGKAAYLLRAFPELGFCLDFGHAFLEGQGVASRLLKRLSKRLTHVHVSDNFGRKDLHLPLGAGLIDWSAVVKALKKVGYDRTVTVEVFSADRDYAAISKRKFAYLWRKVK